MITILMIIKMMISQFKESAVLCAESLKLFPLMAIALLNKTDTTRFAPRKMKILEKNL